MGRKSIYDGTPRDEQKAGDLMVREARRLSETGIYHVIFRGVNRYDIFEEDKDYERILDIISDLKENMKFEIYAYFLISNHVHIIIKEASNGDISLIMYNTGTVLLV